MWKGGGGAGSPGRGGCQQQHLPVSRRTKARSRPTHSPPRPPARRRYLPGQRGLARPAQAPLAAGSRGRRRAGGGEQGLAVSRESGEGVGAAAAPELPASALGGGCRRRLRPPSPSPSLSLSPSPGRRCRCRCRPSAAPAPWLPRRRGGAAVPAGLWLRRRCCRVRTITRAKSSG